MRRWVIAVLALLLTGVAQAEEAVTLRFDLADVAELTLFEASTRYAVEGGVLLSHNRADQAEPLFLTTPRLNLGAQRASVSVQFRAEAAQGGGNSRIFLGLGEHPRTNLATGDGKLGVRVFKPARPASAERPWTLQLVNGVATRNLGEPFALTTGRWYRLAVSFALTEDGRAFHFEASLEEVAADADDTAEDGLLRRADQGRTQMLASYQLGAMCVGLLGQHHGGGASAFRQLALEASPLPHAAGRFGNQTLREVHVPAPPMPDRTVPPATMFGVCGHFMHHDGFYRDGSYGPYWRLEYTLRALVHANFGWVREPLYQPWFDDVNNPRAVENRQTIERYLRMYQDRGVKVMLVAMAVNDGSRHTPFREAYFRWLGELIARYSCVRVVELHNEPNLRFFWSGTAEQYVKVYREGVRIMRESRPDITIAVGSMSSLWWQPGIDWFEAAVSAGLMEFADAVAVHPYNKKAPPEQDPHFQGSAPDDSDHLEQAIDAFAKLVRSHTPDGRTLPMYFTELGYSSGREGPAALGDEQLQADYLSRLMMIYLDRRLHGTPIEAVFWYDLKNDGRSDHAESNFGLIGYDTSRTKPAYEYYRRIATFFDDPAALEPTDRTVTSSNIPLAVKSFVWRRKADGALVVPYWRMEQRQLEDADFVTELALDAAAVRQVTLHRLAEQRPRDLGYRVEEMRLIVAVPVDRAMSWLVLEMNDRPVEQ